MLKTIFYFDREGKDRFECISAAVKTFHSLIEAECCLLFTSQHVFIKLRRVTTHCRELLKILVINFEQKDKAVKEFSPFMTVGDMVSWLYLIAKVCCNLSNPSAASLFTTFSLEFMKYISSTREGGLLKAKAFNVHGDVLLLLCKYETSISYYEQARIIRKELYGEQHPDVAASYNNLGNVYRALGQHVQAKENYEKALMIIKEAYGEQHPDVAASYSNVGVIYRALGQYSKANKNHQKALIIRKEVCCEHHPDVAASYNNLGVLYNDIGHHQQAKDHHEKALII